jgi:O-antigen ligase
MALEQADRVGAVAKIVDWWRKGVFFFLTFSILLLGIGRTELPLGGAGLSAWSVSRTTFFFWLIWKLLVWFRYGREGLGLKKGWFPLPLLAFYVVVTISLLPDFHEAADYRYFFFAVMHCVMVMDVFATLDREKLLLLLLGVLPGLLVIRGVSYSPSIFSFEQMNRFPYPFMHPNSAGLLLCMSIPLALATVFSQNGWLRGVMLGSLGTQFAGLILTYSRGAWLGCVISLSAVSLMAKNLRRCVLALSLIGLVALLAIAPLRHRVMTLENPVDDEAVAGRVKFMTDAFIVGLKHPLFGVGYGRDRLREGVKEDIPNSQQVGFIPHSHSIYTEMLAETGLVGLGALMWMVLLNITRLVRRARSELSQPGRIRYFCMAASLIAFLVACLTDVPFYNHDTRIFFFTLLAMTYLALRSDVGNSWQIGAVFFKHRKALAKTTSSTPCVNP